MEKLLSHFEKATRFNQSQQNVVLINIFSHAFYCILYVCFFFPAPLLQSWECCCRGKGETLQNCNLKTSATRLSEVCWQCLCGHFHCCSRQTKTLHCRFWNNFSPCFLNCTMQSIFITFEINFNPPKYHNQNTNNRKCPPSVSTSPWQLVGSCTIAPPMGETIVF